MKLSALLLVIGTLVATTGVHSSSDFDSVPDPDCLDKIDFRTYNGECNNLKHREWGIAGSHYLPGDEGYEFAEDGGFVQDRPNPRTVSNRLADLGCPEVKHIERKLTLMNSAFGQFLTHDCSSNAVDFGDGVPIPLEDPDDRFHVFGVDFSVAPSTGVNPQEGKRAATNSRSPYMDLDLVYGLDVDTADALRAHKHGKLLTSDHVGLRFDIEPGVHTDVPTTVEGDLLDFLPTIAQTGVGGFPGVNENVSLSAGDARVEQNAGLTLLHLLFVREHNRICDQIKERFPTWTDDAIFQHARKMVIAEYQHITYNEYLPSLLGSMYTRLSPYAGYDQTVHPQLTNAFETVAFRYGHSTITEKVPLYDECGCTDYCSNRGRLLGAGIAIPDPAMSLVLLAGGSENILRGMCFYTLEEVDVKVSDSLRNTASFPNDLLAANIQRGIFNGAVNYNTLREHYRGSSVYSYKGCNRGEVNDPLECFLAINSDEKVAKKLQALYHRVDKVDPLVGCLAEDHVPGSSLGLTPGIIIAKQFEDIRKADRFWYENEDAVKFMPHELEEIRSMTLSKMLRLNFGIKVQHNVFYAPESYHDFVPAHCQKSGCCVGY